MRKQELLPIMVRKRFAKIHYHLNLTIVCATCDHHRLRNMYSPSFAQTCTRVNAGAHPLARILTVNQFCLSGFNPVFDETFEFHVNLPELAMVRFVVLDDDFIGDAFIGQYTVPFVCMQQGKDVG